MAPTPLDITFLRDGGQPASDTADRLIAFLAAATTSLDIAVYDAHLDGDMADRLLATLDAAEQRGVRVRAVYNDDHRRGATTPPPPPEGPSLLQRLSLAVTAEAIPGVPDLMHHKYVIRDADAV